jgi:hypothetical protein
MVRIALVNRAHVGGDVERIGSPAEREVVVLFKLVRRRLGDEGVGAHIVDPDSDFSGHPTTSC